jgi:hypothetical protein
VPCPHAGALAFGRDGVTDSLGLRPESLRARKQARLAQGSALPIDSLLHDVVRHALGRGFWGRPKKISQPRSAQLSADRYSGWWPADLYFAHDRREPRCGRVSSPALPVKVPGLPVTSVTRGQLELRQSAANLLGLPILIAVCLLAVVVRQLFVHPPSAIVFGVCAAAAALDIVLAVYLLRNMGSTLVVTADDITFTRHPRRGPAPQQVIQRAAGSTLSFRVGANGIVGSQYTGYVLKLRDNATGKEVFAGAFGRRKVQQACEEQGWSFA